MTKIENIQAELRDRCIDAWLFCDHHRRDAISYRILGLPESLAVSRRWFYLIPAQGEPVKLLHRIEPFHLDSLPGKKDTYAAWQEFLDKLRGNDTDMT
jgi:Xaa-Pro dipeptidase